MTPTIDEVGDRDKSYYTLNKDYSFALCSNPMSDTIPMIMTNNELITAQNNFYTMEQKVRIRKLTPTECFRLMDVSDFDIKKIQDAGISKSQQYKMAGNSIVVSVLTAIFDKMFIHTEVSQPTLFDL